MYRIAITNRNLCSDIIKKISELDDYDFIILREKDLSCHEYMSLAKRAIAVSSKIVLHSFIDVAEELNYKKIHLPYRDFAENISRLEGFDMVGVSTHSFEEALSCESLGADYITFSHIFPTECKKGLKPRGIESLKNVCRGINIPVYALGGINSNNIDMCIRAGANGVCLMSEAMK